MKFNINKIIWKEKEKEYNYEIKKIKIDKWREFINKINEKIIYQINKYIINIFISIFIFIFNINIMTKLKLNLILSIENIIYSYTDIIIDFIWGNKEVLNRIIIYKMIEK